MNRFFAIIAFILAAGEGHTQIVTEAVPGHVVYGKHGGYTCQPAGATCAVPQTPDVHISTPPKRRKAKTDWPKVVSAHIVLDSVQAKTPGNEHVKQCGQTGPNETCWDPSLRHIVNHLYGTNKERCEHDEGVPCEELQPCTVDVHSTHSYADYERCRQWVPIGKPVFEDKTPEPEAKPLAIARDEWFTTESLIVKDNHGCVYSFTWDEEKQACSTTIMFGGVGAVFCSPLTVGPDPKTQTMVCWYKPEAAADKK